MGFMETPNGHDGDFRGPKPGNERYRDREWLHTQYVEKGLSLSEIAEKCNVVPKTIGNWRDRFGFEKRDSGGYTDGAKHRDEAWLREHYVEKELSLWEMATMCEASADTIRRWLNRYDIETRPPGHPHGGGKFYDTQPWKRLREFVISGDDSECVECGISRQDHLTEYGTDLHVHHIEPVAEGGAEFDPGNLETLCHSCHSKEHTKDGVHP